MPKDDWLLKRVQGLHFPMETSTRSADQQYIDEQQNAQIAEQQQQNMQQPVHHQPVYQQPAPPPATPVLAAPSSAGPDTLEQFKQLGALRDSKVLTEAEFEAAKKKLLGEL
jgi:Short C-terminal domain